MCERGSQALLTALFVAHCEEVCGLHRVQPRGTKRPPVKVHPNFPEQGLVEKREKLVHNRYPAFDLQERDKRCVSYVGGRGEWVASSHFV